MRIMTHGYWVILAAAVAAQASDTPPPAVPPLPPAAPELQFAAEDLDFFEKKIRPVLVEQCYQCHSAAAEQAGKLKGGLRLDSRAALLRGGESGPAIAPGNADESLLLDALRYEAFQMPPRGRLPAAVVADFKTWVERGAADPRTEVAAPARRGIDLEAGRRHWSYRPLSKPQPPQVANAGGPIDAFILARLAEQGLHAVALADRATLARRLHFDLIGLPPTPAEIDNFTADESPESYERLVDRLLASPQFGERWGRHWLDVARFAESLTLRGFVLPEAWRYRDYVVAAFNADLPFDRFIEQQIAGDLLPASSIADRQRNLTATTFLVLGNTNLEEQDKQQLRMDVVDEQLDAIGRGFLAQTIGCARCHDHKFDPIPTRDYYALAGILANAKSLEHANVSKWLELPLPLEPDEDARLKDHEARVAALESQINSLKETVKLAAAGNPAREGVVPPGDLPGIVVDDKQAKLVGDWKLSQYTRHYVGEGYIHDLNTGKGEKTATLIPEFKQPGRYEVRLAYTAGVNRCEATPVTVFSADGEKTIKVNQRETPPIDGRFISLGVFRFELNGQGFVIVSNEGTQGHVIVDAVQFLPVEPPRNAPATATQVAAASGGAAKPATGTPPGANAPGDATARESAAKAKEEVALREAELKMLRERGPRRPMVMSVQEESRIADLNVHIRGTVHNLGERVPRGFLQVVSTAAPPILAEHSGRQELAAWIANRNNPLTPRVYANRIWHWLFGAGLVRTPDNFGSTGEMPSHPELLDYLAASLIEHDWSTKAVIREIVLSHAYQRASTGDATALAADPENRLLWRMNRRRLDAECLLDAIQSVSGRLQLEPGGPGVKPGTAADYGYVQDSPRRAIYWPVFRNALPPIFEVFDFADPGTTTGRRNTSTAAPQALYLMNDSWVTLQARTAAQRLLAGPPGDDAARVRTAFRLALGREPTAAEMQLTLKQVAGTSATGPPDAAVVELRYARLVQALFASLDFRFQD